MAIITRDVPLKFESAYAAVIIAWILEHFADEANADANGTLTANEALNWLQAKAQETTNTLVGRAIKWAEEQRPELLPTAHATAVTAKATKDAALEAERAKAIPA